MLTGTITDDQAKALAQLLALLRPGAGNEAWGIPGIRAALHAARHRAPAHELAIAAIRCTQGDARTPAVIAMDGPHWAGLAAAEARSGRPEYCPEHFGEIAHNCRCCKAEQLEGTHPRAAQPDPNRPDPAVTAAGAALVRTVMREHGIPTTPIPVLAGTGAGEASTTNRGDPVAGRSDRVTRSVDCPEAPAQARQHIPTTDRSAP